MATKQPRNIRAELEPAAADAWFRVKKALELEAGEALNNDQALSRLMTKADAELFAVPLATAATPGGKKK